MAAADGTAKSVAELPSTEAAIIGTDVTGRQRMEESLRLTQFSVEHAADSISWLTRDGRFVDVNESFCRHLGYSRADLLNMTIGEVNLTRTPENWSRHWERVRQLGSLTFEVEHRRADGGMCQMEVTANHVIFGGNEYHCSFARDISERKRGEKELAKSERHFRSLIEHAADAIYLVSLEEGRILACNEQACRDTGYSREELLRMSASDIEVSKARDEVEAVHLSLRPGTARTLEGVHKRKDESTFPVEIRFALMEEGEPQLILSMIRDITERKQMEEALRLTQFSVDHAADQVYWTSPEGRFLYVNDSVCSRLGYTREELLGMSVEDITVRMLPEEWSARWELIKAQGSVTFEREHRTKSGETFPVEITATHFEYAGRDHNCAFVRDISQRKRAEEELRESEDRFRRVAAITSDIAYSCKTTPQGGLRIDWMTGATERITGYTIEEIHAQGCWRFMVVEEDLALFEENVVGLPPGAQGSCELRIRHKNGEIAWISSFAECFWDPQTPGRRLLYGGLADISERTRAEESLRESEAKTRGILDNIKVGVALISPQMEILELNPQMRKWFPAVDPGQHPICYHAFNDPPREAVCDYCPTGKTLRDGLVHEATTLTPLAGVVRNYRVVSSPLLDATGEVTAAIEMVEDVTEKLALESQLQQARKMESVGRLAGGVAHDFNNMLGVILGHTEVALQQVDPAQPLYADLSEIKQAAERSADLTRQLLAFARKQTVAPKVLDLNEAVAGMLKMLERLIGEDIDLNWRPGTSLWPVKVDPSQVGQILANLCVNARDAIADVGTMTIETGNSTLDAACCAAHAATLPGDYVWIAVSDNGCGMDKETLARLFEPFFTTKAVGEGTGLGLATVYGIVKQNEGFTNVVSEPGAGATFTIYLPRYIAKAEQISKEGRMAPAARGQEAILLVEDEPAILKLTTRMLESQGYTVLAASTPGEAIRLARERAGDLHLLLTDVVMPEMNGRDLAKNLLSLYPQMRRLFMSGYTANVIAHHGVLDEGVNFIQKPFSAQDLATQVRRALDSEE